MGRSMRCRRAWATSLIICGIGLAAAPNALADPAGVTDDDAPPPRPVSAAGQDSGDAARQAVAACAQFAAALNLAASTYTDFANTLALGEQNPNYTDPTLRASNVTGRTALRQAAAAAYSASGTPGLHTDIAAPMRSWSLGATKLLLLMGMHTSVDRINNAATQLNDDTNNVQLACARAGTHA